MIFYLNQMIMLIKKGLITNYDFLIKNFNSYTENSTSYKNKEDYEVFGTF